MKSTEIRDLASTDRRLHVDSHAAGRALRLEERLGTRARDIDWDDIDLQSAAFQFERGAPAAADDQAALDAARAAADVGVEFPDVDVRVEKGGLVDPEPDTAGLAGDAERGCLVAWLRDDGHVDGAGRGGEVEEVVQREGSAD